MTHLRRKGLLIALRRLMRERRGVSAVEFALILPVMITLFIGGSEVTQGITIKRKVTIATRTIADLVSQDVSVTDADLTAAFAATTTVLAPYSTGSFKTTTEMLRWYGARVITARRRAPPARR